MSDAASNPGDTPARHVFQCIDAHTCGNPVRLIASGVPPLEGATTLEKQQFFIRHFDWIRTSLMYEPRGHSMMSGSFLVKSELPDCDVGVIFVETSGCLPMCGHGTIGTVTIAIEHGLIRPRVPGVLRLETPAGRVDVSYSMEGGKVRNVELVNVPAFVHSRGLLVDCPELGGQLTFDLAYGGNFYAIVDPQAGYPDLESLTAADILRISPLLRQRIRDRYRFAHPDDDRLSHLRHVMWTGRPIKTDSDGRNAVFYGDAAIDRSPCGTGSSARLAQLFARGELEVGERFIHESYVGTQFDCWIDGLTTVGDYQAVVPRIRGWARIYGENRLVVDPSDDPLWSGFVVT
jgi:4-hydroxyproline epimerase